MSRLMRGTAGKLLRGPNGKLARGSDCCCAGVCCAGHVNSTLHTSVTATSGTPATAYTISPTAAAIGTGDWTGNVFCAGILSGTFTLHCANDVWTGAHTSAGVGNTGVQRFASCSPFRVVIRYTFTAFPAVCGFVSGNWVEITFVN